MQLRTGSLAAASDSPSDLLVCCCRVQLVISTLSGINATYDPNVLRIYSKLRGGPQAQPVPENTPSERFNVVALLSCSAPLLQS
jgi:hypothetical protein